MWLRLLSVLLGSLAIYHKRQKSTTGSATIIDHSRQMALGGMGDIGKQTQNERIGTSIR